MFSQAYGGGIESERREKKAGKSGKEDEDLGSQPSKCCITSGGGTNGHQGQRHGGERFELTDV